MKNKSIVALVAGVSLLAASAGAATFTFTTPSGATIGGNAVDAEAVFVPGPNMLTIKLIDLQANPTDVSQLISDIMFGFRRSISPVSTSLLAAAGAGVNVAANGTTGPGTVPSNAWQLNGFHLTALGGGQPEGLIIGPPGPGGVYGNANGSIAGNGPHNPFYNLAATFVLNIPGLTADDVVTSATFSFGTTADIDVPGIPHVPDGGATIMLLGTALTGIGLFRRKI